jgi:adenylosuccinate synthase
MSSLSKWNGVCFVTDATWGDNGKGKIVDLMAKRADVVVRVNGGPNAGHTVENEFGEFKFHLIPSGIFNPKAVCILADTVVIDPTTLVNEIQSLKKAGISVTSKNLLISNHAHLIMPWHKERDRLRESSRGGGKIGTTGRGIGPVYADRTERVGLQMGDILKEDFKARFEKEIAFQEKLVKLMGGSKPDLDKKRMWADLQSATLARCARRRYECGCTIIFSVL